MRSVHYITPNTLRQAALIIGCIFLQITSSYAQTSVENLQNAVEIYNAMREYEDGLTAKTLTGEQITDVKNRMDKGLILLEKVIKEGNADQIKAARYFKNNFKYEYLFILGMKGENAKAYEFCKEIDREMSAYSPGDFPIRYVYFDKNYAIQWDNFAATQAEYFTGFAEIAYNLKKYEDAVRVNRLALAHTNTTNWLKYVSLFKMLDIYDKSPASMTETEQLDYAVQSIKTYQLLSDSERETVAEYKYPTDMRGVGIVLDKSLKNIPAAIARSGEAALASSDGPLNEKTLQLFDVFYRNNQSGDASFHNKAESYARKASALYPAKATSVGLSAVDRLAAAVSSTDCAGMDQIIEKYTYWKQSGKAGEYSRKKQACLDNEASMRKKAEKAARRADRNFNFYVGTYLFPLLKSNAKRDYGVAVNFVFKKTAWEFSYLKIKNNKENVFDLSIRDVDAEQDDLPRWNGFYAHVQPKFASKDRMYIGTLVGYAQKNFESLSASATHDTDGSISYETFTPKVTQYIGMLNIGGLGLVRGFGFDMYAGIGATYSQWDLGNPINADNYTIDNVVLENREETYFSLILRAGVTIGLNFGRGNRR